MIQYECILKFAIIITVLLGEEKINLSVILSFPPRTLEVFLSGLPLLSYSKH